MNKNRYSIAPMKAQLPQLSGKVFCPDEEPFCKVHDCAKIESYAWDESGYQPEARAYAAWSENGLHVLMCANEREIIAEETRFGGDVYKDSCMEWFLQPFEDDARYINVEVNAAGVAHIGFGAGRENRTVLSEMPENVNLQVSAHDGAWWAVAYTIPVALMEALWGRTPEPGQSMRGNFYKCDESIHPHFGSWNYIVCDHPDFHRPECFGVMTLEAVSKA